MQEVLTFRCIRRTKTKWHATLDPDGDQEQGLVYTENWVVSESVDAEDPFLLFFILVSLCTFVSKHRRNSGFRLVPSHPILKGPYMIPESYIPSFCPSLPDTSIP